MKPVKVRLVLAMNGEGKVLVDKYMLCVQDDKAAAFVEMKLERCDLDLSLDQFGVRFLEPAVHQCKQILEEHAH